MNSTLQGPASSAAAPLAVVAALTPPPLRAFTFTDAERSVFRPREQLTVSEHAEKYRIVSKGNHKGPWQNRLVPYLVKPMDTWNLPYVREIYLCFAPQTGKTQVGLNCLNFSTDQTPGPMMYTMADKEVAKRIARRRLVPMFKDSPRTAAHLSTRYDDTSTLAIAFQNGADLMVTWATSAAELASEEARDIVADEIDKWPDYAGKEASPRALLRQRVTTFPWTSKILGISSPAPEPSEIWSALKYECDVVYKFAARCPVCGRKQVMIWENFTWPASVHDPREIERKRLGHYSCEECGFKWDDHARDRAVAAGDWVPGRITMDDEWEPMDEPDRPIRVGFHLAKWYSSDVTLSSCVAQHLKGREDVAEDIVFVTQFKAEEYRETVARKKETDVLARNLADLPSGVIPKGAAALTCGIDSHKRYFRYVVRAQIPEGYMFSSQKIEHGQTSTLEEIENLVFNRRWPVQDSPDKTMGIWRAAIDTGGRETDTKGLEIEEAATMTAMIYDWLRAVPPGRIFGVKGASRPQLTKVRRTQIDKYPGTNKPMDGALELRLLDTAAFKSEIHFCIDREEDQSRRFLFDADTKEDYIKELLAEEKRRHRKTGTFYWKKIRNANHYLDCEVYAMAPADAEWTPSLRVLSAQEKQAEEQPPVAPREAQQKPDKPRSGYSRPAWMNKR
jgi:phage terminase large subunit GpA-like protein